MKKSSYKVPPIRAEALQQGSFRPTIPPDKSLSHRALMFAGLTEKGGTIYNCLASEDCLSTLGMLQTLGNSVRRMPPAEGQSPSAMTVMVGGPGLAAWPKNLDKDLDAGNSGTTARLMAGLLAGAGVKARMTGDASLSKRPMKRVTEPLELMGATFETSNGSLPLQIREGVTRDLKNYRLPVASAQVKSALLLAGLASGKAVTIVEPELSRDHTERWLAKLVKDKFEISQTEDGQRLLILHPGARLPEGTGEYTVPADPSSAAFWCVLAALVPGAVLTLDHILLNPTRTGFVSVLKRAGLHIEEHILPCGPGEEPVGSLHIRYTEGLKPFDIQPEEVPSLIDEVPILMALAATLPGVSSVRGAEELRKKESDRISAMAENLRACGVTVEEFEDGMQVTGKEALSPEGMIETFGDHRLAMAFLVLGSSRCPGLEIDDVDCAAVSYPTFLKELPLSE